MLPLLISFSPNVGKLEMAFLLSKLISPVKSERQTSPSFFLSAVKPFIRAALAKVGAPINTGAVQETIQYSCTVEPN